MTTIANKVDYRNLPSIDIFSLLGRIYGDKSRITQVTEISSCSQVIEGGSITVTIRKRRDNGKYLVDVIVKKIDGDNERIRKTAQNYEEAKRLEREILAKSYNLELNEDDKISKMQDIKLKDALNLYLKEREQNLEKKTVEGYKLYAKKIEKYLGNYKIKDLDRYTLKEFFLHKVAENKNSSKNQMHTILKNTIEQYENYEMEKVKRFSTPQQKIESDDVLNEEEVNKILKKMKKKNSIAYIPTLILSSTGMRMSELLGLQWRDIDFKNCKIKIRRARICGENNEEGRYSYTKNRLKAATQKNDARRTIWVPKKVIDELKRLKDERKPDKKDFIILDNNNNPYNLRSLRQAMQRMAKQAGENGIKMHPHILRHFHATTLVDKGIRPEKVQHRLGHKRLSTTTDIYYHNTEETSESAEAFEEILDTEPEENEDKKDD